MLMTTVRLRLLAGALLFCLALPGALRAQSQAAGGTIEGTITDETGAVLPGATVTVRNTATGATREATSDPAGLYRAPLLPVGPYEVTAALSGFATTRRTHLTLTIGQVLDRRPVAEAGLGAGGGDGHRGGAGAGSRAHPSGVDGGRAPGRQPARERAQLHRLRAHHPGRDPRHPPGRHQLRRPARDPQQPRHRRRRQQQHVLRSDPGPHAAPAARPTSSRRTRCRSSR